MEPLGSERHRRELGRVIHRSINPDQSGAGGAVNSHTWAFDSLGRVSTDANKLGTFTNTYVGVTNRLSNVLNPGGCKPPLLDAAVSISSVSTF